MIIPEFPMRFVKIKLFIFEYPIMNRVITPNRTKCK